MAMTTKKATTKCSLCGIALFFLALFTVTTPVTALNSAEVYGYKFFDIVTGDEIVLKGIDYYPRPNTGSLNVNSVDYFTEENRHIWERDLVYLQELGVNSVRLYSVDPDKNHDSFMCALNAAGIYVIVELAADCPTCAITRDAAPDCYPIDLKLRGQAVITQFARYNNTLAFSTGNEVNHFAPSGKPEWNGPCQKKFLRDMREYIASCDSFRKVPVGLVAADSDRENNALYYNCQGNPEDEYEAAEWYGLNSYVSCDGEVAEYSKAMGFVGLANDFRNYHYSIPVVLTEFGCLSNTFPTEDEYEGQRNFDQARWLITEPDLRDQFSGGFVFEYSIELQNAQGQSEWPFQTFGEQNYGVGYFSPKDCDDVDSPCEYNTLPSFYHLQHAYDTNSTYFTESVSVVNKESFVVSTNRAGRTVCPSNFPSIQSFKWVTDKERGLRCPPKKYGHFQCPANLEELRGNTEPPLYVKKSWFQLPDDISIYVIVTAIALFAAVCALTREKEDLTHRSWSMDLPSSFYRIKDEEGSDESTGLLSMKDVSHGAPYMAIESDSSQDGA